MKDILCVVGTRPEAVKMAPVVHELRARPAEYRVRVCAAAQHRELLDEVLALFEIGVGHDLNVMRPQQSLSEVAGRVLTGLDELFSTYQPDWVLIQGDTTTVMAAALAGFHRGIRVGHVEAGLRTHNKQAPYPEEMNRKVVGAVADLHFAPTQRARRALLAESVPEAHIHVTGNTGIDALLWMRDRLKSGAFQPPPQLKRIPQAGRVLLVTVHRRENWGAGLNGITDALLELANHYPDLSIVIPVHPNPNVHPVLHRRLAECDRVLLLEPLRYDAFVSLLDRATLILTDSGGIQEEAPSLGKPVLVMRDVTERPEGIEAGNACLVGTDSERIVSSARSLLDDPERYRAMAMVANPYGDGLAAKRIAEILQHA